MSTTTVLAGPNVSDESASVAAVVAVQKKMSEVMLSGDGEAFAELVSDDFIAADPSNAVRTREDLIDLVSQRQLVYTSVDVEIDAAKELGQDLVVLMGVESTKQDTVPVGGALREAALAGTLHRRFTNVYRLEDNRWRLLVKQSTVISID